MRLADEIREQIQAFIEARLEPHELAGWLDSIADEVGDAGTEASRLSGRTHTLLAELGYGDRTIDEVRGLLTAEIAPVQAVTFQAVAWTTVAVATGTSGVDETQISVLTRWSQPAGTESPWIPSAESYGGRDPITSVSPERPQFAEA